MSHQVKIFSAALCAVLVSAGVANAQLSLATNGDFELGSFNWGFAGVGTSPAFPPAGGNPDGHAVLDQTAGGWGGVFFSDNGSGDPTAGDSLTSLGVTAGDTYDFSIDLISLGAGTPLAGMKIESWGPGGLLGDSGDVVVPTSGSWTTLVFPYTIDPGADNLKFVPLMVGQPVGSIAGFDNVGVIIPEPATLGLLAFSAVGLMASRRRR